MTHDQEMMVFAVKCNVEDGNAETAGQLTRSLAHQLTASKQRKQTPKQAAFYFFLKNAGYSYDPKRQTARQDRAECARKLAKAERDAKALGYSFEWIYDEDGCTGCDCGSKDCKCSTGESHETYVCVMLNGEPSCYDGYGRPMGGAVLQSLGGICEPSKEYRRVVEAELALEELG
jgi:hypothetical protein